MSVERLKVVRLDLPLDSATFDGIVNDAPQTQLAVGRINGDDAGSWKLLEAAHIYHVSSAKDEMPRQWFVADALLARCPNLLAVSSYGAGYDTVDAEACTRAGVCVMNQAGSNAGAVAEHAMGFILGLSKRIGESDRRLRRGERFPRADAIGTDLDGRTLGIVGIGHAGSRTAHLAKAFGMTVVAYDPLISQAEINSRGATPVTFDELLMHADIVTVHCPLDATTRGMFDATAFAKMKRGALFVTTARGGIHDEAALFDALQSGHIAGAGLDVWEVEPPAVDHPLLTLDNVMISQHTAGVTIGARRQMALMAATQIVQTARGERPPRLVNPAVWPAYVKRFERVTGRKPVGM